MGASKPHASDALARLASGIEAGVIGGLAMLGVLVSGLLLRGHAWWQILNLFGSTFYGSRAFRSGPGMATISGAALHFTITGTVGGLFGLACGAVRERKNLVPLGLMAGVVWYFLADELFWRQVNPWVPLYVGPLYGNQPVALLSHAVFGACLGWMGTPALKKQAEEQLAQEIKPEQSPAEKSGDISAELN